MLPLTQEISTAANARFMKRFSNYYSRRGKLNDLAVQHACLRDLNMFQVYLWLCVLQGSLATVEHELVALCVMVLETVGISWTIASKCNEILMDEILRCVNARHQPLLESYARGIVKAFACDRTPARL